MGNNVEIQHNYVVKKLKQVCKRDCYNLIEVEENKNIPACIIHNSNDKVIIVSSNTNTGDINDLINNYFTIKKENG